MAFGSEVGAQAEEAGWDLRDEPWLSELQAKGVRKALPQFQARSSLVAGSFLARPGSTAR